MARTEKQGFVHSKRLRTGWWVGARVGPLSEHINVIELWHGELLGDTERYRDDWRVLDRSEQAHAGKITNDVLHRRYVEVHGRLRKLLAETLDQPADKIRIAKSVHGKPYLIDHTDTAFNLSHSGNNLLIAVARNCQLGVDLEICKPRANLAALVGKCFAEEEAIYWHNLPETEKTAEFYRFWTRKEAFVKATGRGIALGLNDCVINPVQPATFLRVPPECGWPSQWQVLDIDPEPGICAAIVADKPIAGLRYKECPGIDC